MGTVLLAGAAGFGLGLSLIAVIGAQNAFLLRQGLRGEHVGPVVTLCAASDVVLITAAVLGMSAVLRGVPTLVAVLRAGGAAFLAIYAVLAVRRALCPATLQAGRDGAPRLAAALGTAGALTWLNPHVYLDTVLLIGTVAAAHDGQRWPFGIGAMAASCVWFPSLGYGARLLRPVFARPVAWRTLDAAIAAVMASIAVSLVRGLF